MGSYKTLGFDSYGDYLQSDHWQDFKDAYRRSKRPKRCVVCGATRIQLHHHTYARIGCERLDDVDPLCSDHHEAVHAWLRYKGLPVESTCQAIAFLRRKPEIRPKKQKARRQKKKRAVRVRCEQCKNMIRETNWSRHVQRCKPKKLKPRKQTTKLECHVCGWLVRETKMKRHLAAHDAEKRRLTRMDRAEAMRRIAPVEFKSATPATMLGRWRTRAAGV